MKSMSGRIMFGLFLGLLIAQSRAAEVPTKLEKYNLDRRAGLIEVLPPAAMQQAPQATQLIDRMIHRHAVMLQSPALIEMVMKRGDLNNLAWVQEKPESAVERIIASLHIRTIPDTNIIEIAVDRDLAGDDAPKVVEAIVDQYMENEKTASQNKDLERSVMLNNMKQRYQFRKDDINRDLREKTVQLSVDGMGMPGRVSAKELELKNLLDVQFDIQRKILDAPSAEAKKPLETQLKTVTERLDACKADLGALNNALNQYLVLKDDQATTRELLQKVNEELERIVQQANASTMTIQWLSHPSRGKL